MVVSSAARRQRDGEDRKPDDRGTQPLRGGKPVSDQERGRQTPVGWTAACQAIARPTFRVHDLRHTCASLWLGAGADPKVVQRILGHASAAMTMDLYGHLFDHNLWAAADRVGGTTGAPGPDTGSGDAEAPGEVLGLWPGASS